MNKFYNRGAWLKLSYNTSLMHISTMIQVCTDPEGGGAIGFLIQCQAIFGPPVKRHINAICCRTYVGQLCLLSS